MNKKGKLYLIPSELASGTAAGIIPETTKEAVRQTNFYFVENTRTARRFISALKVDKIIDELTFIEINKHLPDEVPQEVVDALENGENIGVISEAGMPGIADPGAFVTTLAHNSNIEVVPLSGPSSVFLALAASGFNGQAFTFHGYLPIDHRARAAAISNLENTSLKTGYTQIFMETPYRNSKMMEAITETCRDDTELCLAVNITAHDQSVRSMKISEWKKKKININKKPCIFLIQAKH